MVSHCRDQYTDKFLTNFYKRVGIMIGIQGIDKILFTGIPDACTITIDGDTGVLKTTFTVENIKAYLEQKPDDICIYINIKDDMQRFRQHFDLDKYEQKNNMHIYDYEKLLNTIESGNTGEKIFKGIAGLVENCKKQYGDRLKFIVLDPINSLYNHLSPGNLRRNLYHFFSKLADLHTQNWIICEQVPGGLETEALLPCHFLSDGIIELGIHETSNDVIRYMEIKKMRGVSHSLKRFQISYKNGVLKVLGCAYE
jgi:KaiC/GvpD/RAD55 family RecA-like ATPase